MASEQVLIVDDDKEIAELMRVFLEDEGFGVNEAYNTAEALDLLQRSSIDCILLDVMMPGQDGFDLCRQIRRTSDVPILFFSARDEDLHKIRGLSIGGDDYIVKSATPEEVVARVKAVLRRYGKKDSVKSSQLNFGELILDLRAFEATVNSKVVALSPKEFEILCLFAENPRQVFTYDQLIDRFWDGIGDKHTVIVHVGRIREKIEPNVKNPKFITNVWGIGYRFEGGYG